MGAGKKQKKRSRLTDHNPFPPPVRLRPAEYRVNSLECILVGLSKLEWLQKRAFRDLTELCA